MTLMVSKPGSVEWNSDALAHCMEDSLIFDA